MIDFLKLKNLKAKIFFIFKNKGIDKEIFLFIRDIIFIKILNIHLFYMFKFI